MFQHEVKAAFTESPGPKVVSKLAFEAVKENQQLTRQLRNEVRSFKKALKASRKQASADALASQQWNRVALAVLPRSASNPVLERKERVVVSRAKVSKKAKKFQKTSKKIAADKAKAARLKKAKEVRQHEKSEAEWRAAYEATEKQEKADRAAWFATKEAEPPKKVTFVENIDQIGAMIDEVLSLSNPALFLDAEGISLSRTGTMVFLQMCTDTEDGPHTYVIDVWVLKTDNTFHTPGKTNTDMTFKAILENPAIPKLFWDCRMDSEALHAQHGISLAGVLDIQLMEVARRSAGRSFYYILGYGKCVDRDAGLDWYDARKMREAKSAKKLFIPDCGGSWDMLTDRPLDPRILDYCAGDVLHMLKLFGVYARWLFRKDHPSYEPGGHPLDKPADFFVDHRYEWSKKAVDESAKRIERSQKEGWDRSVDHMTVSPWAEERVTFDYGYYDC